MYAGGSHALLGHIEKAREVILRLDSELPGTSPDWVKQAQLFHKADVQLLAGRRSEAFASAAQALGDPPVLHSSFFAGAFARWMALTSVGSQRESDAQNQIKELCGRLERFDALDQVEILCATCILGRVKREDDAEIWMLIERKLAGLPQAISEQLIQLQVLPLRERS
jgi:hypothetical protein